jgi:hypothetical protein
MQSFNCLLASLVFAVHAVLGCGFHNACQHGFAVVSRTAADHVEHACAAHDHGDSHEPADDDQKPADPCQHVACSFVKAETPRIDLTHANVAWLTAMLPVTQSHRGQIASATCEPICKADLSSAQLYVWHCALLI